MTDLGQFQSPQRKAPRGRNTKWRSFRKNIFVSFFIDLLVIAGTALVLSLLIKTFLVRSFFIPSESMLNTLHIDDRIIVNQLVPDFVPVQRGDVIVFKDPGDWLGQVDPTKLDPISTATDWVLSAFGLTAPDSSEHLVKRVIGIGGDHVICCDADGKITINGKPITESYLAADEQPSTVDFDVTVPDGSYWVMGDNRDGSADSRFHLDSPSKGFVARDYVVGRAFLLTWPFSHFTWLDNYSDDFKDIPKP